MARYGHVLVVGGTGMLAEAVRALAVDCDVLTLVARTERSLRAVDASIDAPTCERHLVPADWSDPTAFVRRIAEHVDRVGAPALTIAWLHDDSLGPAVARAVAREPGCDFVQVRGSRAAAPGEDTGELASDPRFPPGTHYDQVVLGFIDRADGARWLTHSEISQGLLRAIDHPQAVTVIGTVEPWDRRP